MNNFPDAHFCSTFAAMSLGESPTSVSKSATLSNDSVSCIFDKYISDERYTNLPEGIKRSIVVLTTLTSLSTTVVDACADQFVTSSNDLLLLHQLICDESSRKVEELQAKRIFGNFNVTYSRYNYLRGLVDIEIKSRPVDPIARQEHFRLLLKKITWSHFVSLLPSKLCVKMRALVFLKIALELEKESKITKRFFSPHFSLSLALPDFIATYYQDACKDPTVRFTETLAKINSRIAERSESCAYVKQGPLKEKISQAVLCSESVRSGLDWKTWKNDANITLTRLNQLIEETVLSLTPGLKVITVYNWRYKCSDKSITVDPETVIQDCIQNYNQYKIEAPNYNDIKVYYTDFLKRCSTAAEKEPYEAVLEMIDRARCLNRSSIESASFVFSESQKMFGQEDPKPVSAVDRHAFEIKILNRLKQMLQEVSFCM